MPKSFSVVTPPHLIYFQYRPQCFTCGVGMFAVPRISNCRFSGWFLHFLSTWSLWPWSSGHLYTQPKVCLPIRESITTTVQHQIAGFQRGLNLSKLATHGYNNVITIYNSYKTHNKEKRNKIRASADAVQQDKCVYRTISRKRKSTT